MLKNRVSSINNLDYQEIAIDERKVVSTLKQVLPLLQKPEPAFTNRVAHIDIADMEEIAVQRWLYSLDLKCETANVYWVAHKKGIRIRLDVFFQHYSDLWYPSADDVIVTDEELSWLLEMHHEEIFSLWRLETV